MSSFVHCDVLVVQPTFAMQQHKQSALMHILGQQN